jgi:16S rRNA (guanine1207-N2)-methyltransferase
MPPQDPHFKKSVTLDYGGRRLELRVAHDLFSSHEVDVGTRLLLRTLAGPEHGSLRLVLDLGCGYGPIGLGLKAAADQRVVHMVDRDALAVEYTVENATVNGLDGVEVYGSLGYDDVRTTGFDLITSNIPAKAGPPVIEALLLGAADLLAPGGLVAVVVVAALEANVEEILARRSEVDVVRRRTTASYAVFHYRFSGARAAVSGLRRPAPHLQVYERRRFPLTYKGIRLEMRTAYGLPEFDTLSFASELVADAIVRSRGRPPPTALVFNPGQGYLPSLLWQVSEPRQIRLVDRDLLALRFSETNLRGNGCPPDRITVHHRADLAGAGSEGPDVVVGVLRPKEPSDSAIATIRQAVSEVAPGGRVIFAASSTVVTRCLAALEAGRTPVRVVDRKRRKGFSVVVLDRARTV